MKKIIPLIILVVLGAGTLIYIKTTSKVARLASIEANTVDLSAQVASTIDEILTAEGKDVTEGTTLIKLKCEDLKLEFSQLEKDLLRVQKLYKDGVATSEAFEKIQTSYQVLKAKVSWCEIKSPQNLTVNWVLKDKGEFVGPGQKIISLIDLSHPYAWFYISQRDLPLYSLNQIVQVKLPELQNKTIEGRIIKINDSAEFTPKNVQTQSERDRLVYGLKVEFSNNSKELKSGMTVELQ